MIGCSKNNTIDDCELDNVYLRELSVDTIDCKVFEESKTKTINPLHEIDNRYVYAVTVVEGVENAKDRFYSKFSSIVTLLIEIKSLIRNYLDS